MPNQFTQLKRDELIEIAQRFNVKIDNRWNDFNIATEIITNGVTWDMYRGAEQLREDLGKEKISAADMFNKKSEKQIVKMDRANASYEVMGVKFTRSHPFQVMDAEDAFWIAQNIEGFRVVSQSEAESFYK